MSFVYSYNKVSQGKQSSSIISWYLARYSPRNSFSNL